MGWAHAKAFFQAFLLSAVYKELSELGRYLPEVAREVRSSRHVGPKEEIFRVYGAVGVSGTKLINDKWEKK